MTLSKKIIAVLLCFYVITGHSQELAKKPFPVVKDWFLSTGNWQTDPQLYVCEIGTGTDTVIMLHGGWGGDYSGLIPAIDELSNRFHFILYDQRGSLRSPFPDSLISFDQHIEDIERLRKEFNLEKLTIVGHSMGAVLASAYAAKYPGSVKRLVLLAPAPLKDPLPEEEKKIRDKQNESLQQFLNRPEVARELEKHNLNRQTPALSSREETMKFRINLYKRMVYDVTKCDSIGGGRALYKANVFTLTAKTYPAGGWNYLNEFKSQSYPVTIILGDHDFLDFGAGLSKKWVSEVPRLTLHIVRKAGHVIWLDQPETFAKLLSTSLKK